MKRLGVLAVVVAAAALTAVTLAARSSDDGTDPSPEAAVLNFTEVVRRDLTDSVSYDGTLGFTAGEPIVATAAGTLTSAAAEGTVVVEGDILYSIDTDPTTLLYGPVPAWRPLEETDGTDGVRNRRNGTVTWVPDPGTVVRQGDALFEIDNKAVVLLYGDVPAWRAMRRNDEGADVLQLETALVALGFDPDGTVTVDDEFTSATENIVEDWQDQLGVESSGRLALGDVVFLPGPIVIRDVNAATADPARDGDVLITYSAAEPLPPGDDVRQLEEALRRLGYFDSEPDTAYDSATSAAVRAWQADIGVETTGRIDMGAVVFLPGPVRVSDRLLTPGAEVRAGMAVLATTGDEVLVTVDLPAEDRDLLDTGQAVTVVLPDDRRVSANVLSISSVATRGQNGSTFETLIRLDEPAAALLYDQAPVEVEVVTDRRSGVLAVPVSALVALAEGGYAVEVDTGAATRLVGIEPGLYADGFVEISGDIDTGMRVVIP